jgi:hypothetical protein
LLADLEAFVAARGGHVVVPRVPGYQHDPEARRRHHVILSVCASSYRDYHQPPRPSIAKASRSLAPAVRREGAPGALPTRARALTSARNRNIQREADMTPRIPENFSWLADWNLVIILGDAMPPRDPNDDDDDDAAEDDGDDEDDDDPAVIREPDEDE